MNCYLRGIWFLIGLAFSTQTIRAQLEPNDVVVKMNESIKMNLGEEVVQVIGYSADTAFVVLEKKGKFRLLKYADLQFVGELNFELKGENSDMEPDRVVQVGRNLFLITSVENKSQDKSALFAIPIDAQTLSLSHVSIPLIEGKYRDDKDWYEILLSEDGGSIAIISLRLDDLEYDVTSYNDSFSVKWKNAYSNVLSQDEYFIPVHGQVDNEANVIQFGYVVGKSEFSDQSISKYWKQEVFIKSAKYLRIYYSEGSESIDYPVDLEGSYIKEMQFKSLNNGDIMCYGLYSESPDFAVDGVFGLRIDAIRERTHTVNKHKFDDNFRPVTMLETYKAHDESSSNRKEYFILTGLNNSENSQVSLDVLTVNRFQSMYIDEKGFTRSVITYMTGGVSTIHLDSTGKFLWGAQVVMPRPIENSSYIHSDSYLFSYGGRSFCLHNDVAKILDTPINDDITKIRLKDRFDVVGGMLILSEEGIIGRRRLVGENSDFYLFSQHCQKAAPNKHLIIGQDKKVIRLGYVTLN